MTSIELYQKFHLLLNSNIQFKNVRYEKANFVLLFNREKDRWLSKKLEEFNLSDEIFDLQSQYVNNAPLIQVFQKGKKMIYNLPEDFFSYANCYSLAQKNGIKSEVVNYFTKPKDELELWKDKYNSPSFEYEESICNISEDKLSVYFSDYEIQATYLSYYKEIPPIDLKGYTKIDGVKSSDKNISLNSFYQEQILDMCVSEAMRANKNQLGFQLSKERENSNL